MNNYYLINSIREIINQFVHILDQLLLLRAPFLQARFSFQSDYLVKKISLEVSDLSQVFLLLLLLLVPHGCRYLGIDIVVDAHFLTKLLARCSVKHEELIHLIFFLVNCTIVKDFFEKVLSWTTSIFT